MPVPRFNPFRVDFNLVTGSQGSSFLATLVITHIFLDFLEGGLIYKPLCFSSLVVVCFFFTVRLAP